MRIKKRAERIARDGVCFAWFLRLGAFSAATVMVAWIYFLNAITSAPGDTVITTTSRGSNAYNSGGITRFERLVSDMKQQVQNHCTNLLKNTSLLVDIHEKAWQLHVDPWFDGQKYPFELMIHKNDHGPIKPETSSKAGGHIGRIISQLAGTARQYNITDTTGLGMMDIGVNYGWVTFTMASMGIDVYSFEPMQSNIEFLRTSLCLSPPEIRDRVVLFDFGLSDSTQECIIISADNNVGDGQVHCHENKDSVKGIVREVVKLKRLDDILPLPGDADASLMQKIIAVKMDTEGHEPFLVEGGKDFFRKFKVPVIHSEFNNKEMKKVHANAADMMNLFFDELGYDVFENRPTHIGRLGSGAFSREVALNINNFNGLHDLIFQQPIKSQSKVQLKP